MGRFDEVKKAIDANIRQNGRQEITGRTMNAVLNEMVSATSEETEKLDTRIGDEVAALDEKMKTEDTALDARITETSATLNTRIDEGTEQLSKLIIKTTKALDAKIDAESQKSVKSVPQTLTAAQQLQARKNIGTFSGITVDLDELEGVFDDSYTVMDFLQGSDNTAKNKAVCDYIMAQLPSNATALQLLCARGDYPAFELRMSMEDEGNVIEFSVYPRLYMIGTSDEYVETCAIQLLPLSVYGNYLNNLSGVGLIDYIRDQIIAMPGNFMPELFPCYFVKDGSPHSITPSGAARFQQLKPLYLSSSAQAAGAEYTDEEKARGRELLGCLEDTPITAAELESILK